MKTSKLNLMAALAVAALSTFAAGCATSVASTKTDPVEVTFWACDMESRTTMLGGGEAALCSENFEQFKKERFAGDFAKMTAYYNANKVKYAVK